MDYLGINNKKKKNSKTNYNPFGVPSKLHMDFGNHNKIKTQGRVEFLTSSPKRSSQPLMVAKPPKSVYNKGRLDFLGMKGPYGDNNQDGTPNKFSCTPGKDPSKDGKFADAVKNWKSKVIGTSSEERINELSQQRLPKVKKQNGLKGFYQTITDSPQKKIQRFQQSYRVQGIQNEINSKTGKVDRVKNEFNRKESNLKNIYNKRFEDINSVISSNQKKLSNVTDSKDMRKYEKKIEELQRERTDYELRLNNRLNKLGEFRDKRVNSAQAESAQTLSTLRKMQVSQMKQDVINQQRNKVKRNRLIANVGGAFTPAGTFPSQYQSVKARAPRGTYSKPGRPAGVYKYSIPGKGPVHVYEWRKWVRQQRAALRAAGNLPSQQSAIRQVQQRYQSQAQPPMNYSQVQQGHQVTQPQRYPNSVKNTVAATQVYQPTPEELQQQAIEEQYYEQNNPELQAQYDDQLPQDNKFVRQLEFQQGTYQRDRTDRMRNEQPADFLRRIKALKEANIQEAHNFSVRNSILNAHKQNLTEAENKIDFLDNQSNSILNTGANNIMTKRPDSIDLLNTGGRPNILQASNFNNIDVSSMNPMNATRLNFGKINLTDHPDEIA